MPTLELVRPARHRLRRAITVVVAIVALLTGFVSPAVAGAGDVVRKQYAGTDHWDDDSCGYATTVDSSFSGVLSLRQGKGPRASFFFRTDRYEFREKHTVIATGDWYVIR